MRLFSFIPKCVRLSANPNTLVYLSPAAYLPRYSSWKLLAWIGALVNANTRSAQNETKKKGGCNGHVEIEAAVTGAKPHRAHASVCCNVCVLLGGVCALWAGTYVISR